MVWMPVTCPICGSDKHSVSSVCGNCHDRDAEADAIYQAREKYSRGRIDQEKLEQLIWEALSDPPEPSWSGTRLVLR